jgi:hypothetical protein
MKRGATSRGNGTRAPNASGHDRGENPRALAATARGQDPVAWLAGRPARPHRAGYASGIRREEVVALAGLFPDLPTPRGGLCGAAAELLIEGIEADAAALWQANALAFAALQRAAHDQAELLVATLAALAPPPTGPDGAGQPPESSLAPWFGAIAIVVGTWSNSFGAMTETLGQSRTELHEIGAERTRTWTALLQQWLGIE